MSCSIPSITTTRRHSSRNPKTRGGRRLSVGTSSPTADLARCAEVTEALAAARAGTTGNDAKHHILTSLRLPFEGRLAGACLAVAPSVCLHTPPLPIATPPSRFARGIHSLPPPATTTITTAPHPQRCILLTPPLRRDLASLIPRACYRQQEHSCYTRLQH